MTTFPRNVFIAVLIATTMMATAAAISTTAVTTPPSTTTTSTDALTFSKYIADIRAQNITVNASYEEYLHTQFNAFDLDNSGDCDAWEVQLAQNRSIGDYHPDCGGTHTGWWSMGCVGAVGVHNGYTCGQCFGQTVVGFPWVKISGCVSGEEYGDIFCIVGIGPVAGYSNHGCHEAPPYSDKYDC